jgi:hypothetical protein
MPKCRCPRVSECDSERVRAWASARVGPPRDMVVAGGERGGRTGRVCCVCFSSVVPGCSTEPHACFSGRGPHSLGMSVKVKVPDGKTGGDLLQIQVPEALMDPEFRAKQEVV